MIRAQSSTLLWLNRMNSVAFVIRGNQCIACAHMINILCTRKHSLIELTPPHLTAPVQHLTSARRRATYNLYQQVVEMQKRQRRGKAQDDPIAATAYNLDSNNTVDQLTVIQNFLHSLEDVLNDARRRLIQQLEKQGTGPEEPPESPSKSGRPKVT